MFDRLRDAFRAALDAATPPGDLRDLARQMREAVIEAKVSLQELREALARTEREVGLERQRLADAERRGRLAAEIQDTETVTVAERFATKHRERVAVLERKLGAQGDELALLEREVAEMHTQLKQADRGAPGGGGGFGRRQFEHRGRVARHPGRGGRAPRRGSPGRTAEIGYRAGAA